MGKRKVMWGEFTTFYFPVVLEKKIITNSYFFMFICQNVGNFRVLAHHLRGPPTQNQLRLLWKINSDSIVCRAILLYGFKDKYRVSRPTKNRPETSTAAGVMIPHIPDTNCAGLQR